MNERIQELAEQCTYRYESSDGSGEYETFDKEKFAELIVKECAGVAEVSMPVNSHPDDVLKVKNNVLEHFGVKE